MTCAHVVAAQMHGTRTIVIEDVEGGGCRHSIAGEIKIQIFGVGKIAEHTIIESTVKTFAAMPAVVERWGVLRLPCSAIAACAGVRAGKNIRNPPLVLSWLSMT